MPRTLLSSWIWVILLGLSGPVRVSQSDDGPIRVVVWDEQQPRQKQGYKNFLGNAIADYLKIRPGLAVRSMRLDDAEQGLSKEVLDYAQVLVWWGHVRQHEIKPERGREIVARIRTGQLALVALHSAHWSTPFVEAMNYRAEQDARQRFPATRQQKIQFELVPPPLKYTVPAHGSLLTPAYYAIKQRGVVSRVRIDLPNCCFPDYRPDGKPSEIEVLKTEHPIARGLPPKFEVAQTEMYNEPFHVPQPDEVIFKETWAKGEWFRSGCVWNIGKGKVFYFRPGHETYSVYHQQKPLLVIENAVRWLAAGK